MLTPSFGSPNCWSAKMIETREDAIGIHCINVALRRLWMIVQVKWRGRYPTQRLFALRTYINSTESWKVISVIVLTPLPSLAAITFVEVVPLNSPSAGLDANDSFFVRVFIVYFALCLVSLQQFCHHVGPSLPSSASRIVFSGLLIAVANTSFAYMLALTIGFPVPFTLVACGPSHLLLVSLLLGIPWYPLIRANPAAAADVVRGGLFFSCQALIIVAYSLYFHLFTLIPGGEIAHAMFFCLLPIIKLVNRRIFQKLVRKANNGDELTVLYVVFNADILGALFAAFCMQFRPSLVLSVGLALSKMLMTALTLHEIRAAAVKLVGIRQRVFEASKDESFSRPCVNLLDEVANIIERYGLDSFSSQATAVSLSYQVKSPTSWYFLICIGTLSRRIFKQVQPANMPQIIAVERGKCCCAQAAHGVEQSSQSHVHPVAWRWADSVAPSSHVITNTDCHSSDTKKIEHPDRSYAVFVLNLLSAVEFMILVEYVEVVVPFLYSLYLVIMFHLPNRVYYAQFAGMDADHLARTVFNVFVYTFVEFTSLTVILWSLYRSFRISPMQQLAFVLKRDAVHAQSMLLVWLVYATQSSLSHFGNDFSFKFAWLRSQPNVH